MNICEILKNATRNVVLLGMTASIGLGQGYYDDETADEGYGIRVISTISQLEPEPPETAEQTQRGVAQD